MQTGELIFGELKVDDAPIACYQMLRKEIVFSSLSTLFLAEIIVTKGRPVRETYGVVCLLVLHIRMFHLERLFPAIGLNPQAPKRDRFFCSLDQPKTEYTAKNDLELLALLTSFCKQLVVYTLGVEVGLCASAGTLPAKLGSQSLAA